MQRRSRNFFLYAFHNFISSCSLLCLTLYSLCRSP
jgi:hypothetical protein